MWDFQRETLQQFLENSYNIILKSRQLGISCLCAAYAAWLMLFHRDKEIFVIATTLDTAINIVDKVRVIFENLPSWLAPKIATDNKKSIFIKNGSRIKASTTTKKGIRSESLSLLIMDEAAHAEYASHLWTASYPTLSTGGDVVCLSSPNGRGSNWFYQTYKNAVSGIAKEEDLKPWNPIKLSWDVHPERDEQWLLSTKAKISEQEFQQEYNCSFIASGNNVIPPEHVEWYEKNGEMIDKKMIPYIRDPIARENIDHALWIWKYPESGRKYEISCLPKGEAVLTNKGIKNIEEVGFDDKLIDENGKLTEIINKQKTIGYDDFVYEIKTASTYRTTKFTGNHPILSSTVHNIKRNFDKYSPILEYKKRYWEFDFKFNKVEELKEGDWVVFPNIYIKNTLNLEEIKEKWSRETLSPNTMHLTIDDSILIDKDFWWFVGMWLAEGWIGKTGSNKYTVHTCHNLKTEKKIIEKIEKFFIKYKRTLTITENVKSNCVKTDIGSKQLSEFLVTNFGKYAGGKFISEWVKFIPNEYKMQLIKGYLEGDGCKYINRKGNLNMAFVSVSLKLLEDVQDMLFSLGVFSFLNILRDESIASFKDIYNPALIRTYKTKKTYQLFLGFFDSVKLSELIEYKHGCVLKNRRIIKDNFFSNDLNNIYFKIKKINKIKYSGEVYNFETKSHTFLCKNLVTHNCDVARGTGKDFSAFHVIDIDTNEQVAEYKSHIPTDTYAQLITATAIRYNNAFVIVENTGGYGHGVLMKILELNYKNIYWTLKENTSIHPDNIDEYSVDIYNVPKNAIPGFNTSAKTRPNLINQLEEEIRTHSFIFHSVRLKYEFESFVFKNGKPQAASEEDHDDLILALAIGLYIRSTNQISLAVNQQYTESMLSGIFRNSTDLNKDLSVTTNQSGMRPKDPYTMRVGKHVESIKWLVGN